MLGYESNMGLNPPELFSLEFAVSVSTFKNHSSIEKHLNPIDNLISLLVSCPLIFLSRVGLSFCLLFTFFLI